MNQAINYRLQKNPIVQLQAETKSTHSEYLFQLHNLRKERVIKCILTLCAINVHLGDSCALGILRKPFHSSAPFALSMDRQPCGKRHRLCQCQKRENHQKHLQVTVELTELKSTLGDVQNSLTSSLASIQGDINPDVLMFYVFSRYSKVMCRCFNVRSMRP